MGEEIKKGYINSTPKRVQFKKGTLTVHQKSSPGRGMLPNFSPSSGSSRTVSASRTGGVWVFGEGDGMQEGSMRESSFFPLLR